MVAAAVVVAAMVVVAAVVDTEHAQICPLERERLQLPSFETDFGHL